MIAFFIIWTCSTNAQYYEEILMDSLQRIMNNSRTKVAGRIDPLTFLSQLHASRGDSVFTDPASAGKYLDLMQQAAEKSGNKDLLCVAMSLQLNFDLQYPENDKTLLTRKSTTLENFLSENTNKIQPFYYGFAVCSLMSVYLNAKPGEQPQSAKAELGVGKHELLIKLQQSQIFIISIAAILVIVIFILLTLSLNRQKKIAQLEKEKAKLIAQQVKEDNDRIGKQLIINTTELNRKDLLIEKAKDMDKEQFDRIVRYEQKKSKLTTNYVKLFNEINSDFYKRLQMQASPNNLSNNDLKYCAYISLRMSNKELANVMNVEYNTVVSQKYRLKKKFHLSENDSLEELLLTTP